MQYAPTQVPAPGQFAMQVQALRMRRANATRTGGGVAGWRTYCACDAFGREDRGAYCCGHAQCVMGRVQDARGDVFLTEYPWNSPYAFAENRVIDGVDWEWLAYAAPEEMHARYAELDRISWRVLEAVSSPRFYPHESIMIEVPNRHPEPSKKLYVCVCGDGN